MKKLYRSETDKILAGVCGGVAEYLQVDATIVRIITFILCIGQIGILWYILAAVIMPTAPYPAGNASNHQNGGYTGYYNGNNNNQTNRTPNEQAYNNATTQTEYYEVKKEDIL